ncbi:ribonuclease HII [Thermonema lapsum]|uniref:Ribonuclease HII n=2 Tax=Thermonema lapsum TaxID=28195 RepID=A0A846MSW8_9BACT|nr:ribonuclease HII [Thermonema lapsum]
MLPGSGIVAAELSVYLWAFYYSLADGSGMLLSRYTQECIEVGVDEVGRGCLAGPVVAAAVVLPDSFCLPSLNDSKQLKEQERIELAKAIRAQAIAYAIAEASVEEIDRYNILQATFLAMHRALDELFARLSPPPDLILVDGNRFKPYPFVAHRCIVKGDSQYASIAAASILAKVYRDNLMKSLAQQFPEYGWESNVGYPTSAHKRAIAQYGMTPWHRKSFKVRLPSNAEG